MLRLNSLLSFCFLVSLVLPSQNVVGQPPKEKSNEKGPAFTEPPNDDPTYILMGEFAGVVKSTDEKPNLLGLQIRVIGEDQLDAVAFLGGLPGHKSHQPDPFRMIGKRSGEFVVLSGGPWAIIVEKNICRVIDRQGENVGQLKRIKRRSPTLFANPPEGATVLFDGTGTGQFVNAEMTTEGLLKEGADVKPMFQDFNLHIEFRLPYMPQADGQNRANSGLYLQSRYECQVLDSFAQTPKIDGCGALYRFKAPDLNMCFPPLVWQTYDVQFTAPRWNADGTKIRDARVTSWINGTKVQDDVALKNKTGAGKPEGPFLSPIKFQNHGDPVRFRNVWVVDRGLTTSEFPIVPSKEQVQSAIRAQQQKKRQQAQEARKRAAEAKQAAAEKAKAMAEEEKAKAAAEEAKAKAEQAKAQAEKARAEAEQARAQAEQARADAERAKLENEKPKPTPDNSQVGSVSTPEKKK
jgi:hypothetical protein